MANLPPEFPMRIDETRSAAARWQSKEVKMSIVWDKAEDERLWRLVEQGELSLTRERVKLGTRSVRVISPTVSSKIYQTEAPGRPHGKSSAMRIADGEDWSAFNRVAFWVYPEFPGFRTISMSVVLHNDGSTKVPDGYLREGIHYFLLKPEQWNYVVWEIDHLSRDRVVGLEFVYRLQGSDVGAAKEIAFDIGGIELQRVEADYFEGWAVAPGKIAFSHTGYAIDGEKTAFASMAAERFRIVDAEHGAVVLEKEADRHESAVIGTYSVFDFSELRTSGCYRLQAGDVVTQPFVIAEDVWRGTIWKTLNFFYCLRCGTEIPGIHGVCHRDFRTSHDGKEIVVNGGWHDAGDLSQGLLNTSEAVYAMLTLAQTVADDDPILSRRLIEEARWGLEWVLKTRFGDGYRTTWATMDLWTDGIIGTVDDEVHDAANDPLANFTAAATEALAGRALLESDRILGEHAVRTAAEDWHFAMEALREWDVITASAGLLAAVELCLSTGDERYKLQALEFARYVVKCQQTKLPDWSKPIRGFFYTTPDHREILHAPHRSFEQAPVVGLTALIRLMPDHPELGSWYTAVLLYADYLRQTAVYTQPYGMLPAGIYDLEESEDEAYRMQVLSGIPLSDRYYLRLFPVWYAMRGNSGTVLAQTKALAAAARLRNNAALRRLAEQQLEWTVGKNPFAQSLMYGEGFDYAPQYTATSGDICGSLPVGIQTRQERDIPYWPVQNCYNYKEVWVYPSARWLWLLDDLYRMDRDAKRRKNGLQLTVNEESGHWVCTLRNTGSSDLEVSVNGYNADLPEDIVPSIGLKGNACLRFTVRIADVSQPWSIIAVPDGQIDRSVDAAGL